MHQKIQCVTSLPLSLFSFSRTVVYTDTSCVDTEVMLPLLVNLAILICLCVYVLIQQKMCLVHPLVATLGNISRVCKKTWLWFLPLCIRAAFSLFRQRKCGQECWSEGAGEQDTFIPGWTAPGHSHRAVHHKSSEGSQYDHLLFHPSMPSCHLKLLLLWRKSKIVEEIGCGVFSHAQGKGSSPFEALALRLDGKTLCQGGKYRWLYI